MFKRVSVVNSTDRGGNNKFLDNVRGKKIQPQINCSSFEIFLKEHVGSVEMVFEKRSVTVCYNIGMVRKML